MNKTSTQSKYIDDRQLEFRHCIELYISVELVYDLWYNIVGSIVHAIRRR